MSRHIDHSHSNPHRESGPVRARLIKELVVKAIAMPADQRAAFIASECDEDHALAGEIRRLVAAHEAAGSFLGSPTETQKIAGPAAHGDAGPQHKEILHTRVGPYRLLEVIGEGGFGTVYLAEQREPISRRVALKIIKPGMDSRMVLARFEAERQALALMEHPHIARVLDGGLTEAERPYFVMEYVVGDPITDFADARKLSVRQRLDLFSQVCSAVQHAHQKGVIHRDLKPANILVSEVDGKPFAKVIDFGIAKSLAARLTEKTLFTEHRQLIGTPEYMSPEQAEGSPDIDTRTDVYALGVLLYELLTGLTPHDAKRLRSAAFAEMQRIIKEEEPPAPSVRLYRLAAKPPLQFPGVGEGRGEGGAHGVNEPRPSGSGRDHGRAVDQQPLADARGSLTSLHTIAAHRSAEPAKLSTLIKGELDWIVMKALDKDRARRYESPNQFAADVQRHLAGEPVIAAPPSAAYRLRKFVRKHRGSVMAGSAVAAALVLGIAGTTWQWRRAKQFYDEASINAASAYLAQQNAEKEAKRSAQIVSTVTLFAKSQEELAQRARNISEDMMNGNAPREFEDAGALHDLIHNLDTGALEDSPQVEIALRSALVGFLQSTQLNEPEAQVVLVDALALSERWLGEDHPTTLQFLLDLMGLYHQRPESIDEEQLQIARSYYEKYDRYVRRRMTTPPDSTFEQWASSVIDYSTQYGNPSWAATQSLGEPDTFRYDDHGSAWAPKISNDGEHYLSVAFTQPVFATGVMIRETYGNGFIRQVDVIDQSNTHHTMWIGSDPSQEDKPVDFFILFEKTRYLVNGVTIYIDTDHSRTWEEVDAVKLFGHLGAAAELANSDSERKIDLDTRAAKGKFASQYVEVLLTGPLPFDKLLQVIESDSSLSVADRTAALQVFREHRRQILSKAGPIYEQIVKEFITHSQREAALEQLSLPPRVTEVLLGKLASTKPNAYTLNTFAWNIVKTPGASVERLAVAVEAAQEAAELNQDNGNSLNTLGVALYRQGDLEASITTLQSADELYIKSEEGTHPANWAFIAMAQHKLGRADEAQASFAKLQELMEISRFKEHPDCQAFFKEAQELIEGSP